MLFLLGAFANWVDNNPSANLPILRQSFQACVDAGDMIIAAYAGVHAACIPLWSGMRFGYVLKLLDGYQAGMTATRYTSTCVR